MVVENDRELAASLGELIKTNDGNVEVVFDGVSALEAANKLHPDVSIIDLGLPYLNGLDVARAIRSTDWGKNVALISITGWQDESVRRRSADAGFDYHFDKPVPADALLNLLAKIEPGHEGRAGL